jgi:chemotaxis protein CheD
MIEYKLNIGDLLTSTDQASYTCNGLGSCVGLFIQDRMSGLSGGAHIFLPGDIEGPSQYSRFCSATLAIEEILRQMKSNGSSLQALRAKVAGGADFFDCPFTTGECNSKSVIEQLVKKKIFIAASDLGGSFFRTVKFESASGLLHVSKPQINYHETY